MLITFFMPNTTQMCLNCLECPFTPEVSLRIIIEVNFSNDVEEIPYLSWN
jgi:hypothetical protein